jgi:hypothetical protein
MLRLRKERQFKEDGRYIIYYTFDDAPDAEPSLEAGEPLPAENSTPGADRPAGAEAG